MMDLQMMRVDGGQFGQLDQDQTGHPLMKTCGPVLPERWNQAGFTASRDGITGKKYNNIW
jgi:hypothetical protein